MSSTSRLLLAIFCLLTIFMPVDGLPAAVEAPVVVEVLTEGPGGFTVSLDFRPPELCVCEDGAGDQQLWVDLPGTVTSLESEGPALPILTSLVAVPPGFRVRARIRQLREEAIDAGTVLPRDLMPERSPRQVAAPPAVEVGESGWMRWLRVAPVVIRPVRYLTGEHRILAAERMELEFEFIPDPASAGLRPDPQRYWSAAFEELFRTMLLNPSALWSIYPGGRVVQRGSYVIITDSAMVATTTDFAEWKRRKGFDVVVEPMAYRGISPNEIHSYLQDAYDNWERPPEFVLLVGDVNRGINLPAFRIQNPDPDYPNDFDVTDQPYVFFEGDDYFPDAFVGRISCDSPHREDALKVFLRTLSHEMDPLGFEDQENSRRATIFAGNFSEGNRLTLTPVETSEWLAERLRERDLQIDTFYYRRQGDEISSGPIIQSINRGVTIVSYRGWADTRGTHFPEFYKEDLERLTNREPLPVMTFFVCNTGDFGNVDHPICFGEKAITVGTYHNPHGAVAFYGPSNLHTKTEYNNSMLAGYYFGLLYQNLRVLGPLALRAKLEVWSGFPHHRRQGDYVEFYFDVYNILGDPELNFYLGPPYRFEVTHPERMVVGESYTEFTVRREGGAAVPGAIVHLRKDDETGITVLTDLDGLALIPVTLESQGELEVTIVAARTAPYMTAIPVETAENMIGFAGVEVSNEYDDDRLVTGSPVELLVTLRNSGSAPASGVTAELVGLIEEVEVLDGSAEFGDIPAGESATADRSFRVQLESCLSSGEYVPFRLDISDIDMNIYPPALFRLPASSGALLYSGHEFPGGVINPGQTAELVLTVLNDGSLDLVNLRAEMHTHDESVIVEDDQAVFGDVGVGQTIDCSGDPFRITVLEGTTVGRRVLLRTRFYIGQEQVAGSVFFHITIGEMSPEDPLGPDAYGYYAYEDIDDLGEAPTYEWIELDPEYGGQGGEAHSVGDEDVFSMPLPFEFRFYGQPYDSVSICSNGWLSFEVTWMWNFRNWGIPSPLGPHTLVAPFWDDLMLTDPEDPDDTRIPFDIFTRYDRDEGRFIIEWSRSNNRYGLENDVFFEETFEVVLFDPAVVQTRTGDGEILFQYLEVSNVDEYNNYATVGIEDWNHVRGLEVTFAGLYPEAIDTLRPQRAILFTTDPPDEYAGVRERAITPVGFGMAKPYPNPFNSRTTVKFSLPTAGETRLALWGRQL